MKNKNFKKDLDCAGFGNAFLWQPYENSLAVEVYNEKDMWKCCNPCIFVLVTLFWVVLFLTLL